jgi:hypothetical protein
MCNLERSKTKLIILEKKNNVRNHYDLNKENPPLNQKPILLFLNVIKQNYHFDQVN